MEGDLWMRIVTDHLDQAWPLDALIDGLVCSQGSNDQLRNGVEDSSLPIHVVRPHLLRGLALLVVAVAFDGFVLNTLEVLLTDALVVLDQFLNDLDSLVLKVF